MYTKVVNIYPTTPIIGVNPPIRSSVKKVTKTIEEIRTCLMARAIVEEILGDGSIVRLDKSNYDKIFNQVDNHEDHVHGEETVDEPAHKSDWEVAYEKALAKVDLSRMTNRQKREAKAAARAEADKTIAEANNTKTNEPADETTTESVKEEVVETTDIEADAVKAE